VHKLVIAGVQKYFKYRLMGDTYEANTNRIEAKINSPIIDKII
tara:strand:+ start:102 stop:230 length:129 start_codon:yes stop_codon:yes gene_type:complete